MEIKVLTDMTEDTLMRQDYDPDSNADVKRHLRAMIELYQKKVSRSSKLTTGYLFFQKYSNCRRL